MVIRLDDKEIEGAAEEVRRKRGDKSRTETVRLLLLEAKRGGCPVVRMDGRRCNAPMRCHEVICSGCAFAVDAQPAPRGRKVKP